MALARPSILVSAAHVALEWGLVVAVAVLAKSTASAWAILAAVPVIAARQHALVALAHEGAHGRLFPVPGKRGALWNLALTEILVAWPLLLSTRAYRRVHLAHHRELSTPADPDWVRNRPDLWRPDEWRNRPATERPSAWSRVRHLFGLHKRQAPLLEMFRGQGIRSRADLRWAVARCVHALALAIGIHMLGWWYEVAAFWFLPQFTWFLLLMRVRGIAEHWAVLNTNPLDSTRTLLLSAPARFLVLPKNTHYHLEHHLYPGVPFFALPKLHRRLMKDPTFRESAHITRGLRQLGGELRGRAGNGESE